jgi:hypothetical protein
VPRVGNQWCGGKRVCITYSERVFVALVFQNANSIHRITLSSVASLDLQYFCTLSEQRNDFRGEKILLNIKCVLSLQILSETFLILRRIQRNIIINVHMCSCEELIIATF